MDEFATTPDGTATSTQPASADLVRRELQRILRAPAFVNAPSVSRLLVHLVEQTLGGKADQLKEYSLGVDVFERGESFDPRIDTIVRVQARRLRAKLEQYYRTDGRDDPVVIQLAKGRYVPEFTGGPRVLPPSLSTPMATPVPADRPVAAGTRLRKTVEPARRFPRVAGTRVAATIIAVTAVTVATASLRQFRASEQPVTSPSEYTQLTDVADSATAPALSPDGRMIAFLRGGDWFLGRGQIYVKVLPNGDPVQLTSGEDIKVGPVFAPDGSRVAYTAVNSGLWDTWTVSVNGGRPMRLLPNAAGLRWLDPQHVIFSEMRAPSPHMGVVTATQTRGEPRDIYFPVHERGMAHFSFPSPDRRSVIVVEMDGTGTFQPCRLVPFDGAPRSRRVGPQGKCTAAGWSPDGRWMYFSVVIAGQSHLWRQPFPDGTPEQITFGPTEEEGVAIAPDGRSLITSIGRRRSAIWIHDGQGERPLSTEGFAFAPKLGARGEHVYYLFRQNPDSPSAELRVIDLHSGLVERILPGIAVADNDIYGVSYDVSRDEQEVVFAARDAEGQSAVWLARVDRALPPRRIATHADLVTFGPDSEVFFVTQNERTSELTRLARDGISGQRVGDFSPIINRSGVSPDGEWVVIYASRDGGATPPETIAVPVRGGDPRRLCAGLCWVWWSADGRLLYANVFGSDEQTMVIPLAAGRVLPELPPGGLTTEAHGAIGGAYTVPGRAIPIPGSSGYVFVRTELRRNLYRVPLRH